MSDAQVEASRLHVSSSNEDPCSQSAEIIDHPTGWRRLYYHPITQVSLLGVIFFMSSGMFAALTGLGDGGQVDNIDQANASAIMYSAFAFFGFFSGYVKVSFCPSTNIQVVAVPLITSLVLDVL